MERSIVSNMPLEASKIFLKPRLDLCHQVPVAETINFVYKFKDCKVYYRDIKRYVERMMDEVQLFFAKDIYELSSLEWELIAGRYKITSRGRVLLTNRLRSTYSDGMGYCIRSDALRRLEINPIIELKPRILKSSRIGLKAADISRRIGEKIGVKVEVSL